MILTQSDKEKIIELQRRTYDRIVNIQCEKSTSFLDLDFKEINHYTYDGIEYKLQVTDVDNCKIFYTNSARLYSKCNYVPMFIKTLKDAILRGIIAPMLIILKYNNKRTILKWEDIIVVRDYEYMYFIIDNINVDVKAEDMSALRVSFPVKYILSPTKNIEYGFMITKEGYITNDYTTAEYALQLRDPSKYKKFTFKYPFQADINGFYVEFDGLSGPGRLVGLKNIICIYDGQLFTDASICLNEIGNNTFKLKNGVDSTKLEFLIYYYTDSNLSADNIYRLPADILKEYAIADLKGTAPDFYQAMKDRFELWSDEYYTDGKFEDYYEQILKYNGSLLNGGDSSSEGDAEAGDKSDSHSSITMTGKEINNRLDEYGYLEMPRKPWVSSEDSSINGLCDVLIFVNGFLYEYIEFLKYEGAKFKCPFKDQLTDEDIVEIIHIAGGRTQKTIDYKVITNNETKTCSTLYDLKDCSLFDLNPTPKEYEISPEEISDTMQYKCTATLNIVPYLEKSYKVLFDDNYYYGRDLVMISNYIFNYNRIRYRHNEEGFNIPLTNKFKYCQNVDQYLIFVNGERLNKSLYDLTVPNRHNPYYELSLGIATGLKDGDIIDVYYLPFEIIDASIKDVIPENGTVTIDGSNLLIGLNTENYWYFVNGRKVPSSKIIALSNNTIRINMDIKNTNNLCIVFTGLNENQTATSVSDTGWSEVISNISEEDLNKMLGEIKITHDGEDMFENAIIRKALLLYLYKYYYSSYFYMQPMVYSGNEELLQYLDVDEHGYYISPLGMGTEEDSFEHEIN